MVSEARADSPVAWDETSSMGNPRVLHMSDICERIPTYVYIIQTCGIYRGLPFYSIVAMEDFVKKELVLPGFGLADETSMFWVNQYAWISGRN